MGTPYQGDEFSFPADVVLVDDGEPASAAFFNPPWQQLSDRTAHLAASRNVVATLAALSAIDVTSAANYPEGTVRHVKDHGPFTLQRAVAGTVFSPFKLSATGVANARWVASHAFQSSVTRRAQIVPVGFEDRAARSNSQFDGLAPLTTAEAYFLLGAFGVNAVDVGASAYHFVIPIDEWLIHGAVLASATLYFRPSPGHGALPTRQPSLAIVRTAIGGYNNVSTTLLSAPASGHAILAAASVVAYEAAQAIAFAADQNNTIDLSTYNYVAIICDESGANALAGCEYQRIDLTMTVADGRRF